MRALTLKSLVAGAWLLVAVLGPAHATDDNGSIFVPVPEPGALELLGIGVAAAVAIAIARRRK